MSNISKLIKSVPVLTPEDTVRRAAGLIRVSTASRILVHNMGQIVGTVSEQAISGLLSQAPNVDTALDSGIEPLIDPNVVMLNANVTLEEAAGVFAANDTDILPVIDNSGMYRGSLCRGDVIGLITKNLRPPSVGGMATPLGVYLTTGSVSGGAGSLGLFLTGVSLGLMIVASAFVVEGIQRLMTILTGVNIQAFLASPPLTYSPNIYDLATYASTILNVLVFFVLMRFSPLSGYHAAEHMTVHAMEAGEALTPDNVRYMPRVHPRCGTNLLAAAGVFIILTDKISNQFTVMLALLVVLLGWRTIGGWLQYFVTTSPPSEWQLKSGVFAGNELLKNYMDHPDYQLTGFQRIWKLGFIQTAVGSITILWILQYLLKMPFLS